MTDLKTETLAQIENLQNIQKRNHPDSQAWQEASRELAPLFELMKRISATVQTGKRVLKPNA